MIPVEAAARTMALGRKHGVRTLLNPAPATHLDETVLQNVDYLTPNESELRILLGLPADDPTLSLELADRLRAQGVRNLIVTLGEKGALVLSESDRFEVAGDYPAEGNRGHHGRRRRFQRGPGRRPGAR